MSNFTQIINQIESGDPSAAEHLLPLVYDELRKLATARLAQEKSDQTLQATALVHDAYLRLVDQDTPKSWDNRGHFFAAAAEAMRRILVDNARRKQAHKRGGEGARVEFTDELQATTDRQFDLLELDDALSELEQYDSSAAQLVKLRYFAGFGHQEAAEALGINRREADRLWAIARAWLYQQLGDANA